ncbi:PaaI family thioesterase [Kordiimonas lipolytica]|uniref:PaaI family thioesterase n=1 Tax=Kordiimonas lipolytica TaxID=1662421 RepID=A0ABV8UCY7_9PROT|nr:PaaI family thioesterase [Kordiimonas lipolytica]
MTQEAVGSEAGYQHGAREAVEMVAERTVATTETMRAIVQVSPFTRWTGCEVLTCEEGVCEVRMPFRKDLTQHHGFVHGGIIGFLSDNVSAAAAASVVGDVVTADYSVKLLAPGIGDEFMARGEVVKVNKRLVAVESRVFAVSDGKQKLIAVGAATILPV